MKKAGKIIGKIVSSLAVVLLVAMAIFLAGPRVIGWKPLVVLSGSMEPTYHVGSTIYVRGVSPQEVSPGDAISFYLEDGKTVVTHRVVRTDAQKQCFYTKGDANNVEDGGDVPYSRLIGKPMFSIPMLGYVMAYVNTKSGLILTLTVLVCLIILAILPDLLKKAGAQQPVAKSKGG